MSTKKTPLFFVFTFVFILQINPTFVTESKFHAIYDCIFDTEINNIFIEKAEAFEIGKEGAVKGLITKCTYTLIFTEGFFYKTKGFIIEH